jgi:hypothetical protein
MHVARSDFDAIATTSTAQEPAGAIIATGASIWIPFDALAVAATRSQTAVENDAAVEITNRFPQPLGNPAPRDSHISTSRFFST